MSIFRIVRKGIRSLAGLSVPVKTVTTTYQVLVVDYRINCDASGGAFTVTLPVLGDMKFNQIFVFKKVDSSSNRVTISQGG